MTEREASKHWPTYALRAWMTALLGQLGRADAELNARVESHEKEIARLRAQMQRSSTVITALREAIGSVDNVLRSTLDTDAESDGGQSAGEARERSQEPKREPKKPTTTPADKPRSADLGKS
jgi:hypothetical protein